MERTASTLIAQILELVCKDGEGIIQQNLVGLHIEDNGMVMFFSDLFHCFVDTHD